jgi:predicted AlkP superfamily pyrophosphatase or phosphodiesterase
MLASFPSLTFPNHYTLVTGLRPSHHGLVGNQFWDAEKGVYSRSDENAVADSSWYGGTPLWVLAEKHGILTASFYWVASESAIHGVRPTYYYYYNEKIPIEQRIDAVRNWLTLPPEKRPHLITFYFPEVDHAEHAEGPDSKEAERAVQFVDESIGKMVKSLGSLSLPISYVVVSDHGMTAIDNAHPLRLPAAVDTTKFVVAAAEAELNLYARDSSIIQSTYEALQKEAEGYFVYLATNSPKRWHFGKKDDWHHRIGDIILVAKPPASFNLDTAGTYLPQKLQISVIRQLYPFF